MSIKGNTGRLKLLQQCQLNIVHQLFVIAKLRLNYIDRHHIFIFYLLLLLNEINSEHILEGY